MVKGYNKCVEKYATGEFVNRTPRQVYLVTSDFPYKRQDLDK